MLLVALSFFEGDLNRRQSLMIYILRHCPMGGVSEKSELPTEERMVSSLARFSKLKQKNCYA
jgi:hypothetical protein